MYGKQFLAVHTLSLTVVLSRATEDKAARMAGAGRYPFVLTKIFYTNLYRCAKVVDNWEEPSGEPRDK